MSDELMTSIDATLTEWRSAFDGLKHDGEGRGRSIPHWRDPDEYHRRLQTFRSDTYFAKPLVLSPIVCAAFGWQNKGKDIIRCIHCNGAICVVLHSGLDEESHNALVQQFVQMLASSHATSCPFHSHASRWLRAIDRCSSNKEDAKNYIVSENQSDPELLARQIGDALGSGSNADFYVPPYLLTISDEFLRFEDRTIDGSFTREIVDKGAAQIFNTLRLMDVNKTQLQLIPGTVKDFCTSLRPGISFDYVLQNAPIILSAFGWLVDEKKTIFECSYLALKCNLCQSTPMLKLSRRMETEASTKKAKRGSHFAPDFNPIDSHKYYCPYVSGFSWQSEMPGWKVVLSNLMKSTTATS